MQLNPLNAITSNLPNLPNSNEISKSIPITLFGGKDRQRELDELLQRITTIEKECEKDKVDEEDMKKHDEFLQLRLSMLQQLDETKNLIRKRHDIQSTKGNTVEVIKMGGKIDQFMSQLATDMNKLREVYKKQIRQKKTIGEDELDNRFQFMQIINKQIDETRDLYTIAHQCSDEEIGNLTNFHAQMEQLGVVMPIAEDREMLDIEKDAVARWKKRDQQVDEGLEEVQQVVGHLGELAVNIGEKADQQAEVIDATRQKANTANAALSGMNEKLTNIINQGTGCNFCLKILFAIIIIGEAAFLIFRLVKMM